MPRRPQIWGPSTAPGCQKHGAAGVGVVGDVGLSAGELPHQPGVHGAEQEISGLRPGPSPLHMVQDPAELGGGEVGVDEQAGVLLDVIGKGLVLLELLAQRRGAAALPHDGIVDGTPGDFVPDNGGLTLVGDADGGQLVGRCLSGPAPQ